MDRYRMDLILLAATLALIVFGSVMIYSASFAIAEQMFQGDSAFFIKRHVGRVAFGLMVMIFFIHFDYHLLRKWVPYLLAGGVVCLLLMFIPGIGVEIRGATRTLNLGIMNFQPAEPIKIIMILYLAHWLEKHQAVIHTLHGLMPGLMVIGGVFVLVALQPDFGTAIALGTSACVLLILGRARLTHLGGMLALALPPLALKIYFSDHSRARIMSFVNRWFEDSPNALDLKGPDYQLNQALISLGNGGYFGTGLGEGPQKWLFLPDAHTDFIFAVVGEELGFAGTFAVLALFIVLFWRGFQIARQAPDLYGFLLASGLTSLIAVHVLINTGVVSGILPTTGIPLPFFSYGGSWLVFCLMSIGVLLNISRHSSRRRKLLYD